MSASVEQFLPELIGLAVVVLGAYGGLILANRRKADDADSKSDTMKARLWGDDERSSSGDINSLESRVASLEERQQELDTSVDGLERTNARFARDLHGADGDASRPGLLNEIHEIGETVETIDRKLDDAERERRENSARLEHLAETVETIQYGLETHPDFEHLAPDTDIDDSGNGKRATDHPTSD